MLENFASYIKIISYFNRNIYILFDEINNRIYYKSKGQPQYSAIMIRHALLLRYTSKQAYEILLESFPLPSISLLSKIKQGGGDAIKAVKTMREKGSIHKDVILIVDEFYLQKQAQYFSSV